MIAVPLPLPRKSVQSLRSRYFKVGLRVELAGPCEEFPFLGGGSRRVRFVKIKARRFRGWRGENVRAGRECPLIA
jgi:hypothetical protein